MKKSRIIRIASIAVLAILVKTQTNLWRTEIEYSETTVKIKTPYRFFLKHGTSIGYFPRSSKKYYEVPYVYGKKHGTEIQYFGDGSKIREVIWENDKPMTATVWDWFGKKCSETSLKNGNGIIVKYDRNGKRSQKNYVNGEVNGTVTYYEDGSKIETPFEKGKKHGMTIAFDNTGTKVFEEKYEWGKYVQGSANGTEVDYHFFSDQKRSETPFVNGKIHGAKIEYDLNGNKTETQYVDGEKHGAEIRYNQDGSKAGETPWVNGKEHGTEIHYDKNGAKRFERKWNTGEEVEGSENGMMVWHNKDGSRSETPWVNGKEHGTEIHYDKNGAKRFERKWNTGEEVEGSEEGINICFSFGEYLIETPYVNGKIHGTQIWYELDGSKIEIVYENGKKISEKKF
jgi:antitoxin component YwqK of YwqJK toxin-antitoxin module